MPEGRMLNRRITEDSAVNELSSDACRLAFTWTLPFLDRDGRVTGHPGILRNKVFPCRKDITDAQMEAFIAEWNEVGLAIWYRVKRDLWLEFPTFRKNQHNWRYDREAPSAIPSSKEGESVCKTEQKPAPDALPTSSGPTPDSVPTRSGLAPANESMNEVINEDYFVQSDKNYAPPAAPAGSKRPAGRPASSPAPPGPVAPQDPDRAARLRQHFGENPPTDQEREETARRLAELRERFGPAEPSAGAAVPPASSERAPPGDAAPELEPFDEGGP